MKKILTLVFAVSALILSSCASGGGAEKSVAAKPAEPEVAEPLVGTEYSDTLVFQTSSWGCNAAVSILVYDLGLEPFEVQAGEVYVVTGTLKTGEDVGKGKTVRIGFQETRGWTGWNDFLASEDGVGGQSVDFEIEWEVPAAAAGEHDMIQIYAAGPGHVDNDSIDFTLDKLSFRKK